MKYLLHTFIIFILSFFIIGEPKAEVPDVLLECDIANTNGSELGPRSNFRYKTFIEIKGGSSPTANYFSYFEVGSKDSLIDKYIKWEYRIDETLTELTLVRQINGSDVHDVDVPRYFINRETLIGRTEGFTDSYDQCEILPRSNTIEEYIDNHITRFEDFLRSERDEQLRKNKI